MLILTRRPGESIRVGEKIEVSVLEIRGNQVRVGIHAPTDVLVLRSELVREPRGAAPPRSRTPH